MYLDGQLPYGPVTTNVGPPPIVTYDTAAPELTYTTPEGGPAIIHSSVANADGIVQTPGNPAMTPTQGLDANSASYNQCGDYAADGSLTSIKNRRPHDPACGDQSLPGSVGMGLFFAALAGLMLLTSKSGKGAK
jgi:hypothetical protein